MADPSYYSRALAARSPPPPPRRLPNPTCVCVLRGDGWERAKPGPPIISLLRAAAAHGFSPRGGSRLASTVGSGTRGPDYVGSDSTEVFGYCPLHETQNISFVCGPYLLATLDLFHVQNDISGLLDIDSLLELVKS